jgi:hypothetical protein
LGQLLTLRPQGQAAAGRLRRRFFQVYPSELLLVLMQAIIRYGGTFKFFQWPVANRSNRHYT